MIGCIGPTGELSHVSFSTGMGHGQQFCKDLPVTPMPYGQALAMAALVGWERLQGAWEKPRVIMFHELLNPDG